MSDEDLRDEPGGGQAMTTTREKLIESVSRMMAAAYWRGRLHEERGPGAVDGNEYWESHIRNMAEAYRQRWTSAAKVACGDALL